MNLQVWSINTTAPRLPRVPQKKSPLCVCVLGLQVASCRAATESILTHCRTVSAAGCFAADREALPRVIKSAHKNRRLPSSLTRGYCWHPLELSRAEHITNDSSHAKLQLFDPLPCRRRCRSINTRTHRLLNYGYVHIFLPSGSTFYLISQIRCLEPQQLWEASC